MPQIPTYLCTYVSSKLSVVANFLLQDLANLAFFCSNLHEAVQVFDTQQL